MNDSDFYVFQSDSMDELVKEREKNKALQNLLHVNDTHTRYYYIENGLNGNHAKHSIDTNYLDTIAKTNKAPISKKQQRSDSLFYSTIPLVLKYEGGFVNNPNDRGGKTNMGITQCFLETYKNKAGVDVNDVRNLTKDDAIKLYKAEWNTYGFGKLDNTNVIKLIYDFSVNSGPKVAIKYLQKALNSKRSNVAIDGYIGEQTNKAINSVDEQWLIKEIQKARAEHIDNIVDKHPNQRVFLQGWFNRINDIGRKCGCDTIYKSRHLK